MLAENEHFKSNVHALVNAVKTVFFAGLAGNRGLLTQLLHTPNTLGTFKNVDFDILLPK